MNNVILIVVDAVRHYKSGLDERDRLDVYSELKNDRYLEIDRLVKLISLALFEWWMGKSFKELFKRKIYLEVNINNLGKNL